MSYIYEYPRPMVTVDAIVIKENAETKKVLLIKRLNNPFKDFWALPGGFVDADEDLKQAAIRELKEETSLNINTLKQFAAYGSPGRDPRGHSVSIVYFAKVSEELNAMAGDDAKELAWFDINDLPSLAFDHDEIIEDFIDWINEKKAN